MINSHARHRLATISVFGITHLQRQHPLMVAWWSAAFPGFGHFLLNHYLRATFLTLFEVMSNTMSHLNEAMVFTFCGKFDLARSVLQPRWVIAYIIVYLFAIWDSYRIALLQNKLCHLAELENERLPSTQLFALEVQYMEQKSPLVAAMYSLFFPGLGQFYNHRFGLAFYAIIWWWIYLTLSRAHEALFYLIIGRLHESNAILHPHWLLFMPSVIGGAVYHSYVTAIEHNRLFRLEQRQHLAERYRHSKVRIFS